MLFHSVGFQSRPESFPDGNSQNSSVHIAPCLKVGSGGREDFNHEPILRCQRLYEFSKGFQPASALHSSASRLLALMIFFMFSSAARVSRLSLDMLMPSSMQVAMPEA